MSRLEDELRDLFLRNEEASPLVDLGEPERIARRTRRRQVLVAAGTALAAVGIVAGAIVGIGAVIGSDRSTPAHPQPPPEASVVIELGSFEGWEWVLSASEDGRCVALSDEQGSTTICPTAEEIAALGLPESEDLIGVTVRSPSPPGPESTFVFGIVSPRTAEVVVGLRSFIEADELRLRHAPPGVQGDRGYFVARVDGFPYPVVPDIVVSATDPADGKAFDVATVERPPWAKPPLTLIDPVATVSWLAEGEVGTPREWTFGVWLNRLEGGMLCFPVPSGPCGPREDPVQAWIGSLQQLGVSETAGVWSHGQGGAFTWGTFREPVASVRVELEGQAPFTPDMYPPPASYPEAPSLFTFEYNGSRHDFRGRVVGLDAEGNVIRAVRLGGA